MKHFTRKQNILLSIGGLLAVAGLLAYYIMNDYLWKKEINIGFSGLAALLIYRLVRSFQQEEKEKSDE